MAKSDFICRGAKSPILKCAGIKTESDFYDNWNPWDGEKVCFCKDCLNTIYGSYLKQFNSEEKALYYTCMQINTPFVKEVYNNINNNFNKNGDKIKITFNKYMSELHRSPSRKKIYIDFSQSNVNMDNSKNAQSLSQDEIETLESKWGIQDCDKDYEFLEDTFNRYTKGVDFVNEQQQDLYRDLSRDRLLLRKINDGRYNGEETIDKIQSRISKTMSTLKVDQFEISKPKTASEQLIFNKIAQIEQTKPADLYKEPQKYKDYNKLQKYYKDLILRPLLNCLTGSKNFSINLEDVKEYDIEVEES